METVMRCLTFALLLCVTPPLTAADRGGKTAAAAEEVRLLDKWIVRSVRVDGKPTPAQIGQKVGDIITIKRKDKAFVLS
jgi:hypothetical protein